MKEGNIMSTRAYIGIKNENGKVTAIYNQSDGSLQNLGHLLRKNFKTEEQIRELLNIGYISSIQDIKMYNHLKSQLSSFDESEWKDLSTVNGLKVHLMPVGEPAEELNNIMDVMKGASMICYAYLFVPEDNKWYYTKGRDIRPLKA